MVLILNPFINGLMTRATYISQLNMRAFLQNIEANSRNQREWKKLIRLKNLSLFGGYRILDFRAEDDPDFAKLRILGPFAGITLRF